MTQHRVSGAPNACCQVDLTNNVSQVQLTTLGAPTEQRPTTRYVVAVVVVVVDVVAVVVVVVVAVVVVMLTVGLSVDTRF